jgi:Ni/Fe-hydrogenase subunit HybB-like protein
LTVALPAAAPQLAQTLQPLLPPEATDASITAEVADSVLARRVGKTWWLAVACTAPLAIATFAGVIWLFVAGVGIFGINSTVVWGYAIANYVWWIAIGSGGTLISSMLRLTRQPWRSAISRFAETMTIVAVAISGLFPILHLGRPQYFYWLAPYPNTMTLWPQWRSALVWDFWAILSYLTFSILFWYVGLIPDLATMRDRAPTRAGQLLYGAFALGWRGSARQWRDFDVLNSALAAIGLPLVCSVHSIVGLDFAASLMPGWQETIFPPYFVVGALFSGFAMAIVLAAAMRWGLGFQNLLTIRHFEAMALVLLAGSLIMTLAYATEWFTAWYGGQHAERSQVVFAFAGSYAPLYWLQLLCNCVLPQALWAPRVRRSIPLLVAICSAVLVGMWIERILIIWNTLSNGFLPSARRLFLPTFADWLFLIGPLGLFAFLFLVFARLLPAISMHELRQLRRQEAEG